TDGWRLDGVKLYVPYAHVADVIIVAARVAVGDDGIAFFCVDPKSDGVTTTILDTIGKDHLYALTLTNVALSPDAVLGPERGGWTAFGRVFDACATVIAAQAIGGAERCLELAVEYSKQRVQFGRPIGAFQALQHKMARMATEVTGAQLVVYEAADTLTTGAPAALDVSLAKVAATMAYTTCSIEGCHIFGGAGFVRGSEMELYYRKALSAEVAFGTPRWHKRRIAALMARAAAATPAPAH
ncbi:MAG: acyl-CoA dehydrogenase, partial [Dehalococcoidia bacterium]|nr:acyl-CoA dehydrogenase [Dehalococcoidia bacterium]